VLTIASVVVVATTSITARCTTVDVVDVVTTGRAVVDVDVVDTTGRIVVEEVTTTGRSVVEEVVVVVAGDVVEVVTTRRNVVVVTRRGTNVVVDVVVVDVVVVDVVVVVVVVVVDVVVVVTGAGGAGIVTVIVCGEPDSVVLALPATSDTENDPAAVKIELTATPPATAVDVALIVHTVDVVCTIEAIAEIPVSVKWTLATVDKVPQSSPSLPVTV